MTAKTDRESNDTAEAQRRAYVPPRIEAEDDIEAEALLQALETALPPPCSTIV
jgi:hypothetical protein